ncbi:MAG: hypothetical protein JRG89_02920 [Deltaproteobacteria bacterium]|nr:hypothetical protein [Deltaproteobacteria bacterium]
MPTPEVEHRQQRGALLVLSGVLAASCFACTHSPPQFQPQDPGRYRLMASQERWYVSGTDRVFDDVRGRYPEFFEVILDTNTAHVPNLRVLRDDLERVPVDRRNFDALNAVAIAYYETNDRAESGRGDGFNYLALSQRSAKLLAVPWRAYGETDDPLLRTAIVDFFEDAGSGEKLNTKRTAPRLSAIVSSLSKKELDPQRLARIDALSRSLKAKATILEHEHEIEEH